MIVTRSILTISALALVGTIVWASLQANLLDSFGSVLQDPWGLVVIVDLYVGFIAISVLIWVLEPDWRVRVAVILPLFFLGNPWVIVWIVWRLPMIAHLSNGRSH